MATIVPFSFNIPNLHSQSKSYVVFQPNPRHRFFRLCCSGENPPANNSSTGRESEPTNAVLKLAWYGSELLGIATSFFRKTEAPDELRELATDGSGAVDRTVLVQTIKQDFERSYFVTGNLTLDAYEEDCEFADPASSFKGLRRFKRNCTNFGSLIEKSNMKLMKWEDYEDKGIGHWRFSCILSFPWRPILSASGYTEYFFDAKSGKVCRHVEHWNVPKMALLKQILRPSRGLRTSR
ncbi:hypothetical protein FNV43_RR15480 [Rhamnella rubrinervis]|uniref:Uncharacterized protein n=1 Tax=Rhamnella rubrinervis TaxID=2594499 RepID=A0A8K0GX71_9ROSA|nr:hypothetical protein FNV43_RR15480 [Rhamnella rubrinervis]